MRPYLTLEGLGEGRVLPWMPDHVESKHWYADTRLTPLLEYHGAARFRIEKTSASPELAGVKPLSTKDTPQFEAETEETHGVLYQGVGG